jgi:hypothetical protein
LWCEAPVLMVGTDAAVVEADVVAGRLGCPGCDGELRPWGWARRRVVRDLDGERWLWPRRARCGACGATHVLLPVACLWRRRDAVGVIGAALVAKLAGAGHRRIAAELGVPATTVRGWLRRFGLKARFLAAQFLALAHLLDRDLGPVAPRGSPVADALEAIGVAAAATARRFGSRPVWWFAAAVSAGRLLANTSSPFPAVG